MGKILSVKNLRRMDLKVTAVIKDLPKNSHFHCDFIAPMAAGEKLFWDGFEERNSSYVYLLLRENASPEILERKIGPFLAARLGGEGWSVDTRLQRLPSIHLRSHLSDEIEANGDVKTVALLALLGVVILLVSAINFVNLATARSVHRAREVGLKKVVGAGRGDLVRQFLAEAVLFACLALPAALLLVQVFLPAFNMLLNMELSVDFPGNGRFFAATLVLTVFLGLLSGIYPAFVVSRFAPATVLKGRSPSSGRGVPVRRGLIIAQFAASVVLFIAAAIVFNQLRFVETRALGFERKNVVVIPVKDYETAENYDLLKTAFLRSTAVDRVTASEGLPSRLRRTHAVWHEGLSGGEDVSLAVVEVDFDFLGTYGIRLARGRDFSEEFATDENGAYLINETAARSLGWSEPLGKKIQLSNRGLMRPVYVPGEVVGVVEDFHFQSLHETIRPLVLKVGTGRITHIAVRVVPGKARLALDFLAARWKEILPGRPFDYFFFDDDVSRAYQEDRRTGRIFASSTALSVLLAGLGVFGLASFSAAERTKEVGVRKVLGATVGSIVWMFSKEFGRLVLLANAVAWPAAYVLMKPWVRGFAYRTGIGLWIFLSAGAFSLLVALAASGGLAVRAALNDPVDCLRYE
jgi:putative ABC transport system permease protein